MIHIQTSVAEHAHLDGDAERTLVAFVTKPINQSAIKQLQFFLRGFFEASLK